MSNQPETSTPDETNGVTPAAPTDRARIRRLPDRGRYDRATLDAILDEALVCHMGFAVDGTPFVIPTAHWRVGDRLYVHGSPASRALRSLGAGAEVCVTITLVDGLVMARSAFHHSINYRSAVIYGRATPVVETEGKRAALHRFVEHIAPGRAASSRPPTDDELRQTAVLWIPITEFSCKVRTGGPIDDEEDYALPHWAGVIPVAVTASAPIDDERLTPGIERPDYAREYHRPTGGE